jgi:nitrite reductase/ring-hydroxylating ferredoxin subunit
MSLIRLIAAADLWEGEVVRVDVAAKAVLLTRVDGAVRAYIDRCPHLGVSLSSGRVAGSKLTCAVHGWEFDLATGDGVNPCTARLTGLAVRTIGADLFMEACP